MAGPRHAAEDDGFALSLAKHVGAAVALVLAVAGAFWAIGQVGGDDDGVVVADGPDGSESPSAPGTATPTEDGTSPTATPTTEPPSPSPAEPSPTPTETTEPPSPSPTVAPVDPGEVTVQVLDAVRLDGSTAAQDVADQLREDGYDVVVVNPASRVYDLTTVFYTAGHEDAARQIAAAYGFSVVEEKPSNLSDSVWIHLVVGRDRA